MEGSSKDQSVPLLLSKQTILAVTARQDRSMTTSVRSNVPTLKLHIITGCPKSLGA